MKTALIIACIGHIICGITDCMLAYMKNGRFEFSDVNDNRKLQMGDAYSIHFPHF